MAVWPVVRELMIGRTNAAQVQLDDPRISRRHARVARAGASLSVSDAGSRHGTRVGGQLVQGEAKLPFGGVLRCGDTLLLAVEDCGPYAVGVQRLSANYLGTSRGLIAGPVLARAWQRAIRVTALPHPVLVLGESGTGKEGIARLVHKSSKSEGAPFVALNLAAVPSHLFESELFGHVRGAFTGAVATRLGAFREASGGTLFLDEIGELASELQVKLLRALEDRRVRPVGADREFPFEARIVAATCRDLRKVTAEGAFRRDLFHRLAGVVIDVPPLRARPDDVILLAQQALEESGADVRLSADAAEALALALWPGNVRELHRAIAEALAFHLETGGQVLGGEHFKELEVSSAFGKQELSPAAIKEAMARFAGNASKAARYLKVSRATLYNFCEREGLVLGTLRASLDTPDHRDLRADG